MYFPKTGCKGRNNMAHLQLFTFAVMSFDGNAITLHPKTYLLTLWKNLAACNHVKKC